MAVNNRWRDKVRTLFGGLSNRGFQLDIFVFLLNLGAMTVLSRWFVATIKRASEDDEASMVVLCAVAAGMFVLAPIGATLKRWHFHQSLQAQGRKADHDPMGSCLFNPIFYFCLTAVIFASINAFVLQSIYGQEEPPGAIFVGSILGGIVLMFGHTVLVYRYFSIPTSAPKSAFLRNPVSGTIGDILLFSNMVLFQLIWNLLALGGIPPPSGTFDFLARFFILLFLALLLYFPPRMFYLAQDVGKRRTWAMILLANSPVLIRFLFGSEMALGW